MTYPTPTFETLSLSGGGDPMPVRNALTKFRENFATFDPAVWTVVAQGAGDLVELDGNAGGARYLKISKHALTQDTETVICARVSFQMPLRIAAGVSVSQRVGGCDCNLELVGLDSNGSRVGVSASYPHAITTISQTTTILSATTSAAHWLVPGDRIDIYGCADSRLNYCSALVATVPSSTTFTVTTTTYGAITSVTSSPAGGAQYVKTDYSAGDANVVGVLMDGSSTSNAIYYNRGDSFTEQKSAAVAFGTSFSTALVPSTPVNFNTAFSYAFLPAASIDIVLGFDAYTIQTIPLDSVGAASTAYKRSQCLPEETLDYTILIRCKARKSRTVPVARIVTAAKSGTTTATVTTDAPHGLTTSDYLRIYGAMDQTNFVNLSADTVVASVIDASTFTIVWGAAVTATTHGGAVLRINAAQSPPTIPQAVQSISQAGGVVTVIGSATWAGLAIGETVYLYGLYDTTAVGYPQLEGVYKVGNLSTTTLALVPTSLVTPVADFGSVSMGGAVIKQTDYRLHFIRVLDYTRIIAEVYGGVSRLDQSASVPVSLVNPSSITALTSVQGSQANNSASTANPVLTSLFGVSANPAAGTTAQHQRAIGTLIGVPIQKPYSIPEADWSYPAASAIVNTSDVALKSAGAAGIKNYLTAIQIANTNATATEVVLKDGSTVIWRGVASANMPLTSIMFPSPLKTTAATALNFACITTAASVYVSAQGYVAP
jgi:hypothetical protein